MVDVGRGREGKGYRKTSVTKIPYPLLQEALLRRVLAQVGEMGDAAQAVGRVETKECRRMRKDHHRMGD